MSETPKRKSGFTGLSPITYQAPSHAKETSEPDTPPRANTPPHAKETQAEEPAIKRVTYRLPPELIDKIRGAAALEGFDLGIRGPSSWVQHVLQNEIDRIEAERGQVRGLPAGVIPQGWDAHTRRNEQ